MTHDFGTGYRIFILSPANATGRRAEMLYSPRASFELAVRFKDAGAPIGEVFSFVSGLYFRGKLAYANQFCKSPEKIPGVLVITSDRGLLNVETLVTKEDLQSFSEVPIDPASARYAEALRKSAIEVAAKLPSDSEVVLLGSISSKKYVELLLEIFGDRLKFPVEFVGRGDMSRGGLMLRCVESNTELQYSPVDGAIRHGKRPPKLEPRRWTNVVLNRGDRRPPEA
ncbi:hypothetical protein L0222_20180 [bacterium]|nr:hypothetical protein [bacterium]MCI0607393.1 hypothetical protein [bacterium]